MPTPIFMTLYGEKQGLISEGAYGEASVGAGYQKGRENQIMVQALSHGIFVPKGAGASKRMHKPLVVTKVIDKSTPLINIALCTGELLTECRLEWYRTTAQGVQEHFYTLELEDALIVGADVLMPHCQDASTAYLTQLEKIHFSYRRIYWRHEIGRTMGCDEWQSEAQA